MKIDLMAKNLDLTDPIRKFIDEKVGGLGKLFKDDKNISAKVEIARTTKHHRSGEVYYAEVNLFIDGKYLRAESNDLDVRNAITKTKDALKLEIKKYKEKRKDLSRKPKK